jgi:hypothetical protein
VGEKSAYFIDSENYSGYLSCLYTACYLSKDHSQELLEIMAGTHESVLREAVPKGVKVADKFAQAYSDQTKQTGVYRNCGIIYRPRRPYILCVTVEGNLEQSRAAVRELSTIVYRAVDQATPSRD